MALTIYTPCPASSRLRAFTSSLRTSYLYRTEIVNSVIGESDRKSAQDLLYGPDRRYYRVHAPSTVFMGCSLNGAMSALDMARLCGAEGFSCAA